MIKCLTLNAIWIVSSELAGLQRIAMPITYSLKSMEPSLSYNRRKGEDKKHSSVKLFTSFLDLYLIVMFANLKGFYSFREKNNIFCIMKSCITFQHTF